MIMAEVKRVVREEGCSMREALDRPELWKKDLRAAFTQIDFHPDHASRMGCSVEEGKVIFYTCGVFGWTSTPHAFEVVKRALRHEMNAALMGQARMYVDDSMGVTRRLNRAADMAIADGIFEGLLGERAVNHEKDEAGAELDWIGYLFSLETCTASLSDKNRDKMFHAFTSVDINGWFTVVSLERIASYAVRFGEICVPLRAFARPIYDELHGRRDRNAKFLLREETKLCILVVWCTALYLSYARQEGHVLEGTHRL
jgi:hypothetical protein